MKTRPQTQSKEYRSKYRIIKAETSESVCYKVQRHVRFFIFSRRWKYLGESGYFLDDVYSPGYIYEFESIEAAQKAIKEDIKERYPEREKLTVIDDERMTL